MLLRAPNAQFSAEGVTLELDHTLSNEELSKGPLLCVQEHREEPSQPFLSNADLQASSSFWFKPGKKLDVKIYRDLNPAASEGPGLANSCGNSENLLATGHMTLSKGVLYVDSETMNKDPFKKLEKVAKWREEFDKIGQSMENF